MEGPGAPVGKAAVVSFLESEVHPSEALPPDAPGTDSHLGVTPLVLVRVPPGLVAPDSWGEGGFAPESIPGACWFWSARKASLRAFRAHL